MPRERSAAAYEEFAKYPPESRPPTRRTGTPLHPWLTDNTPTALVPVEVFRQMETLQKAGLSEQEISQRVIYAAGVALQYQFDLNKTILAGTQDASSRQKLAGSCRLPARLSRFAFRSPASNSSVTTISARHLWGAVLLYSASLPAPVAPSAGKLHPRRRSTGASLELQVTLSVEGMAGELQALQAFYSSPMVAGRVYGRLL